MAAIFICDTTLTRYTTFQNRFFSYTLGWLVDLRQVISCWVILCRQICGISDPKLIVVPEMKNLFTEENTQKLGLFGRK